MDRTVFAAIEPLVGKIVALGDRQLLDPELQRVLAELGKTLGKRYVASINLTIDVFDLQRTRSLALSSVGLSADAETKPYRTASDSCLQRYVVGEEIQVVPQDRCPLCWEAWDLKLKNRTCKHCGATLGKHCKLLLDSEDCPWCQKGKVTIERPQCNRCGFVVDPRIAVWADTPLKVI